MHAYQMSRQQQVTQMPRIDLILSVYDGVLERLSRARPLLVSHSAEARQLLNTCQVAIAGMAGGIDPTADDVAANLHRLYEFVVHCLAQGSAAKIGDAVAVLETMREGFEAIRTQAVELERQGQIPALDQSTNVQVLA